MTLLRTLIPSLPSIFPSTRAQRDAFGPALNTLTQGGEPGSLDDKEGLTMDLRDGEAWGLIASFGLQAPPDEQTALVGGLRDKVSCDVRSAIDDKANRLFIDSAHRTFRKEGMGVACSR